MGQLTTAIEQQTPPRRSELPTVTPSSDLIDDAWDGFLTSTPLGQFQQSSRWAAFKASEGWQCERVILRESTAIIGGFQVLWRQTRFGRVGFLYKGPVGGREDPDIVSGLQQRVANCARTLGLRMLIVQTPDDSTITTASFERLGFIQDNPTRVIEATYLVDVAEGMDVVRSRMSASVRKHIRKAVRDGVVVREGDATDLPLFLDLMTATCRRQGTTPSPGSVDVLRQLWHAFAPVNGIRMTFAAKDGVVTAGQLSLRWGRRVSLWKKGWDGSNGNWHANELLEDESLAWSHSVGAATCDFCSINPRTATALLAGDAPVSLSSRDAFNLRFGGRPQVLPHVVMFLPNPILRLGYRHVYRRYRRLRARSAAPVHPES